MPYEGQNEPQELKVSVQEVAAVKVDGQAVKAKVAPQVQEKPERKTISQPSGKLSSTNIGIKSTLNPPKNKSVLNEENLPYQDEVYSAEAFQHAWKQYALNVKREGKESLYVTLDNADYTISSDHLITLRIQNIVQQNELDLEKTDLLQHLRKTLKNSNLSLKYDMEEGTKKVVLDSKSSFDKLAEENSSLHKFRKLFNLDIEY